MTSEELLYFIIDKIKSKMLSLHTDISPRPDGFHPRLHILYIHL